MISTLFDSTEQDWQFVKYKSQVRHVGSQSIQISLS